MRKSTIAAVRVSCMIVLVLAGLVLSSASVGAYNRTAAIAYADQWALSRNTGAPRYYQSYSNDCSNYISQALYAGGVSEVLVNGYITDPKNWYWNGPYGTYSNSWTVSDKLMRHAYEYIGNRFQPVVAWTSMQGGDFFVMDLVPPYKSGPATHGRFVVGYGPYPGYSSTMLINQHTTDRHRVPWNYQITNFTDANYNIWKIRVL